MKLVRLSDEHFRYANTPICMYLISEYTIDELREKELAAIGVGTFMEIARLELGRRQIEFKYYCDNDKGTWNLRMGDSLVRPVFEMIRKENLHFIICTKLDYVNQIEFQLERNGIHDYSIVTGLYRYIDGNSEFNNLFDSAVDKQCDYYPIHTGINNRNGYALGYIQYSISSANFWHPIANRIIKEIRDEDRLLDIGPGAGMLSTIIRLSNAICSISWLNHGENNSYGNEPFFEYISDNDRRGTQYFGYVEDQYSEIPGEKYDKIIMTEVLEHFVCNPCPTLRKINKALKPEGKLYLSTPNWGHINLYNSYMDIPEYKDEQQYQSLYVGDEVHIYQYNKMEMDELIDLTGFKSVFYEESVQHNHNYVLVRK